MKKIGVTKGLNYRDIPCDRDGWIDAKLYIPEDYDLCSLKIRNKRCQNGWSKGNVWDGLKIEPGDEILYWKRQKEPRENANAFN